MALKPLRRPLRQGLGRRRRRAQPLAMRTWRRFIALLWLRLVPKGSDLPRGIDDLRDAPHDGLARFHLAGEIGCVALGGAEAIRKSGYPGPDEQIETLFDAPPTAAEVAEFFERQALEQESA